MYHITLWRKGGNRWWLLVVLATLLYVAPLHAQSVCGGLDGRAFTDAVTTIEVQASTTAMNLRDLTGENETAGLQVWDNAIAALNALPACNEAQQWYKDLTLEWLGWLKAADVCYYSIYIYLATEGGPGIGQWLSCISPVNDAILVIARLRSDALVPALEAPCDGGFLPPDEERRLTAQVFADTQAFVKIISDFPSPGYLKREINRGRRWVVNPGRAGRVLVRLAIQKAKEGLVNFAEGAEETVVDKAAEILIHWLSDGEKALNGPPTQQIQVTTSFTPAGCGTAITSTASTSMR